ncbi:dienelactone hydrolase family protein [Maritimibacter dapengensis]|uniref:Dienelactone hydrolase family protein n=1 Tax=Maritimibacter dapengensis TaxID=2836868 RepID=A0ABS6T6T6_9RHOB|nr:dienelactone hydrolase family protein [Maritimibacter dapengensis]MBV7380231.1 dienelactone hydrolase family protein [Maritimibacter dapengensis]
MSEIEIIPGQGPDPRGVLVIHSWWGLTDAFRDYGAALAEAGFTVGLADLYGGHIARTEAEVARLRRAPRKVPMYRTLLAGLDRLRQEAEGPVGVVGFSMGGHWAVWLGQRAEADVDAVVMYYAARSGDFSQVRAAWLAHFAEQDDFVKPTARRAMVRGIEHRGLSVVTHDYPDTAHWFAETSRPEYDPDAARLALARDIDFLNARLRP